MLCADYPGGLPPLALVRKQLPSAAPLRQLGPALAAAVNLQAGERLAVYRSHKADAPAVRRHFFNCCVSP